jgi:hypothetical protein
MRSLGWKILEFRLCLLGLRENLFNSRVSVCLV